MTDYIPFDDFVPYGEELDNGEQIHINHETCTAGEDTRRRLYIKRTEDGRNILAYCHNCSLSGCYSVKYAAARSATAKDMVLRESDSVPFRGTLPKGFNPNYKSWNSEQRAWLTRYGITEDEQKQYMLGVDTNTGKVILPVFRGGKLLGYQARYLGDDKDVPKYVTKTSCKPMYWYSGDYAKGTLQSSLDRCLCLTEDVLSGIKCARFVPTMALLTAFMGNEQVAFALRNNFDKFIIFLDDDNRNVKLNQVKIKAKLEQIGDVKLITGVGKDPKACSNSELKRLLT